MKTLVGLVNSEENHETLMARKRARTDYDGSPPFPLWGWAVIIVGTIMRLILAQNVELRTDEAYYWTQSKEWVLSTLDHPPLVLYFIKIGTFIFGDTNLGVRFTALFCMLLSQIFLIKIVQMLTRTSLALAFAILAPEAIALFGHMGFWVGPDSPMVLFLVLLSYFLVKIDVTGEMRNWLFVGLCAGLALLSKYTAIFIAPAVLVFILINKRNRRAFASPYFWLAGSIAAFLFLPVLAWNGMNDWASLKFQGARVVASEGFRITTFFDFLGMQFIVIGLVLFPLMVWASFRMFWRGLAEASGSILFFSLATLVPLIYFCFRSFGLRINVTWFIVIYPFAIVATALYIDYVLETSEWLSGFLTGTTKTALFFGFALTFAAFFEYGFDPKARLGIYDPYGKEAGYQRVAELALVEANRRKATWIATSDYRTYSMLKWHLKRSDLPVVQVNERARFIGFKSPNRDKIDEERGLHIAPESKFNPAIWTSIPTSRERIGAIDRAWRGVIYDRMLLEIVAPYKLELNPARTSPLFTPRNLV